MLLATLLGAFARFLLGWPRSRLNAKTHSGAESAADKFN